MPSNDFVQLIKRMALQAVEASKPVAIRTGTVIGINPVSVRVDQKLTLGEKALIIPKNLTDYKVKVRMPVEEEIEILNGLKVGDVVMLLREQGGQKYYILDRVGE